MTTQTRTQAKTTKPKPKTKQTQQAEQAPKQPSARVAQGHFVWFELRSRDPDKTAALLSSLVGWQVTTMPMGGGTYTMGATSAGPVVGFTRLEGDGPARFLSYVNVDDVDEAALRVAKAGGKVLGAPVDVPTVGRMIEVSEPTGARLFLFRSSDGDAPPSKQPPIGAFLWNELWTDDEPTAVAFLERALGYRADRVPMNGASYTVLHATDGASAAGVLRAPAKMPSAFLPYIHVDDVDAALQRARKLGVHHDGEVQDVAGVGRFALLRTADGCRFAIMTPPRA